MEIAMALLRLLLFLVFVVAGLAKLADFAGSRKSMLDFGLPAALAAPFGILLPVCELLVGLALLARFSAWWGAVAALALLLVFILGIAFNLVRGRRPDCHCFGQLHSAPIGWKTLTRNGALSVAAGFVIWQGQDNPGPDLWSWAAEFGAADRQIFVIVVIGGALLALQAWFMAAVFRQNGRLLLRIEALEKQIGIGEPAPPPPGLPVGSPAPAFRLPGLDGREVSLDDLRALEKPVMLLFIEPNCGPCDALLPEVAGWQREHASKMTVAVISRGTVEENRAKKNKYGVKRILLQKDSDLFDAYQTAGTPGAVFVNADGTVRSPVVAGADAIKALVRLETLPPPAKIGEAAPRLRMPGLNGKTINLEEFRGRRTMLLFWNPACGFCRQMLDGIKAWEKAPPVEAPQLLVVSSGDEKETRADGFRSTVVLDKDYTLGHVFGAGGTPSAVMVDEELRIASEVAIGAVKVFELAGAVQ